MKRWMMVIVLALFARGALSYEPGDVVEEKCSQKQEPVADCSVFKAGARPKNVIIFIGDGMGLNHIYSGRVFQNGPAQPLELEKLEHNSLVKTCSLSGVTDSAASATALASGTKTYNGRIGTGPDGKNLEDAVELAKKSGKAIGLVTTDSVVGATPSSFALHQGDRFTYRSLAEEYLKIKPDLLLGGGREWFEKKGGGEDLMDQAKKQGYLVVLDGKQLNSASALPVLGFFADAEMTFELDRKDDSPEPHLFEMTQKALDLLSQDPDGFFLMVEGARIDHASHKGDFDRMLREVMALDQAVKIAKDWQAKNPETLILVTADHETGGMKVEPGDYQKGDSVNYKYTTKIGFLPAGHSGQRVVFFGQGPGAENVEKASDNTQIFCILKNALSNN